MWIKISSRRYDEEGSENGEKVKERKRERGGAKMAKEKGTLNRA